MTQQYELPPLPTIGGLQETIKLGPEYVGQLMQSYALAAIEADRKRRGEPDEERLAMEAVMESVDPATWPGLTSAQRCALGRFAKLQSADPVDTMSASELADRDEPDLAKCAECGAELIPVRPGKWQHPDCSQSYWAAEPVKMPSAISKLIDRIEQSAPMDVAGRGKYLHDLRALLARYGQRASNEERGFLTISWDEDKIVAITRQDSEGKILSVIAESGNPPFNPKEIKPCGF